ncbi:MAG: hypothetical protein R2855_05935 [Thermomicrobiales bacterium]
MFSHFRALLVPLGIISLVAILLSVVFTPSLWRAPLAFLGQHQESQSFTPIDATTLAGQTGLYYLDASHLIGTINTARYSAYADLVEEGQLDSDSVIYTNKNLPTPTPVVVPTLPAFISSVEAGLGLTGGGTSGKVSLAVKTGVGIVLSNGLVTTTLGDSVDLSSDEVVSILPVAKGGTGLSMTPLAGTILVGTGSGYTQALLSAGDGLTLISGNDDLEYALDGTVCRTSGNCSSLGIIGNGTTNYLAKFTGTGAIGSSLLFDDGTNVGIGTNAPSARLTVIKGTASDGATIASFGSTAAQRILLRDEGGGSGTYGPQIFSNAGLPLVIHGSGNVVIQPSTGNVGIGTTSPSTKLDVDGSFRARTTVRFDSFTQNGGLLYTDATGQVAQVASPGLVWDNTYQKLNIGNLAMGGTRLNVFSSVPGIIAAFQSNGYSSADGNPLFTITGNNTSIPYLEGLRVSVNTSTQGLISLYNSGTGVAAFRSLAVSTGDASSIYEVNGGTSWSVGLDQSDSSKFKISFGSSLGSNDRLVINPVTGGIGIGTSSPGAPRLTVEGGDQAVSRVRISNTGASGRIFDLVSGITDVSQTGLSIYDATASSTRLVMDDSGKIGIGTVTPQNRLDVAGGVAIGGYAGVNAAPTNGLIVSGSIGIGTNNPGVQLDVANTGIANDSSVPQLRISGGDDGTLGPLRLTLGTHPSATGSSRYAYIGTGDNSTMRALALNTNGAGAFGNVGIGTVSPSSRLHVESTTEQLRLGYDASNYVSFTTGSTGGLTITPRTTGQLALSGNFDLSTISSGFEITRQPTWNTTSAQSANGMLVTMGVNSSADHTGALIASRTVNYASQPSGITYEWVGGFSSEVGLVGSSGAGTVNNASAFTGNIVSTPSSSGGLMNGYGLYIGAPWTDGGVGSIGTAYGVRVLPQQGAGVGNGYGVRIDDAATASLWLSSDDGDAASGISFGSSRDVILRRGAAGYLNLNATFLSSEDLVARFNGNANDDVGIGMRGPGGVLGIDVGDTNLYRSASDTLKTDDLFVADGGVTIGSGGTRITKHLSATTSWDPLSTASGTAASSTVTVTGAALGDVVSVGFSQALPDGVTISGSVSATNTVKVTLGNLSGSPVDLAPGTIRADVWQH